MLTNIAYYVMALALAIVPTIWEWYKAKKMPPSFKWIVLITIILVIVGIFKTVKDSGDSQTIADNLAKLTSDVGKLVQNRKADSIKNAEYAAKLKAIGITRDTIKNSPVVNKNIYIHSISRSTVIF